MAPNGRPPKLGKVVARTEDGKAITVGDRIVQAVRNGNYIEAAAAAAGVEKKAVYRWMNTGANLSIELEEDKRTLASLSAEEKRQLRFSHAIAEADAEWETGTNDLLHKLGQGGLETTVTTTKTNGDGEVIETTSKVEYTLPNDRVLTWRLERRHPDRYGRRTVEVTGPDGGPIQGELQVSAKESLLASIAAMSGRLTAEPEVDVEDDVD